MIFAVRSSAATERSLGCTPALDVPAGQGDLRRHTSSARPVLPGRGARSLQADVVAHGCSPPGIQQYVCILHEVQHMIVNAIVETLAPKLE